MLLLRTILVLALGVPLASSSCSVADLTAGGPVEPGAHDAGTVEEGGHNGAGGSQSPGRDAESRSDASANPDSGSGFVAPTVPVTVENLLNKRYLDVSNVSTSDGAQVWTWSYTGQLNQLWAFTAMGDGMYEIVNKVSNKCLEVRGETTANGSYIQQFGCHGSDNQRWSVNRFHDHDQIVGKQSGRCLSSSAMEDGATVTILDCSNDSSQHWAIGR